MKSNATPVNSVEGYISGFPASTQKLLKQVRAAIRKSAPGATEEISYGMPGYKLEGPLVYFAGYKNHIGFYPTPSGIGKFKKELSVFQGAKGSVQFPVDQPMPIALIEKIVQFRVKENREKAALKAKKKK